MFALIGMGMSVVGGGYAVAQLVDNAIKLFQ